MLSGVDEEGSTSEERYHDVGVIPLLTSASRRGDTTKHIQRVLRRGAGIRRCIAEVVHGGGVPTKGKKYFTQGKNTEVFLERGFNYLGYICMFNFYIYSFIYCCLCIFDIDFGGRSHSFESWYVGNGRLIN